MVVIASITNVDSTQNQLVVDGTLTLSGNYGGGATHGDTLSFAGFDQIKSAQVPTFVEIWEAPAAGVSATGFAYNFSPGTTPANGVMQVFGGAAGSGQGATEYTQGAAYSAATPSLAAAVLKFRAWFPSLI